MCRKRELMDLGIKICRETNNINYYRMCAIVAEKSKIVSIGLNKIERIADPNLAKKYDNKAGLHCEIAALINVKSNVRGIELERFKNLEMYVTGITKASQLVLSKPCKYCQGVLAEVPLKAIYYHDRNGQIHKL